MLGYAVGKETIQRSLITDHIHPSICLREPQLGIESQGVSGTFHLLAQANQPGLTALFR